MTLFWSVAFTLALVLGACVFPSPEATPVAPTRETSGSQLFAQNCAPCHGDQGEGKMGPPLNHEGHAQDHTDTELYSAIAEGIPMGSRQPAYPVAMPPWRDKLSPREIQFVIDHIKSLWTEEQRRFQAMLSLRE